MNIHFVLWKCCQQLLCFPFSIIQVLGFPSWIFLPRKIHTWRKKISRRIFSRHSQETKPGKYMSATILVSVSYLKYTGKAVSCCESSAPIESSLLAATTARSTFIPSCFCFFFISVHSEESSESMPLLFITSKRTLDTQWNLNIPSSFLSSVYPKFISLSKNELWHDQL